jgi:GNAT superfamily N-acetyltransferase
MPRTVSFRYGTATARLIFLDVGIFTLSSLFSRDRRKGDAKQLMHEIVNYADKHRLILRLIVQQYGKERGLDNLQLEDFYRKYGFASDSDKLPRTMTRLPSRGIHPL